MNLGSREFAKVRDLPERVQIRMKRAKDKIIGEDLLIEDDISILLHVWKVKLSKLGSNFNL